MSGGRAGVVLLNMGGPADQAAVEPFLEELFADRELVRLPAPMRPFQRALARRVARRRGPEVRANYRKIGGGSPILGITRAQAAGVCRRLAARGLDVRPYVVMRYAPPRADPVADEIARDGVRRVVAVSLYPQYSPATGGSSLADLRRALRRRLGPDFPLAEISGYHEEPFYLDAMASMVRDGLDRMGAPFPHVLFSAHGMPRKYIERGDPYLDAITASYRGILARLPAGVEHSLSFQSRVGPLEWLRPYTEDQVVALARAGVRRLLMVPLGFVSDHVETLYEMDLLYAAEARRQGIAEVRRLKALNAHPLFLDGLAGLVQAALGDGARAGRPAAAEALR